MATHFERLKIREVRRETPSTVSIAFEVPAHLKEAFSYKAGQYLTLRSTVGGEELRRSYSLCSSPSQDDYRIAVKEVEGGRFSTWANRQLTAGEEMDVMPPIGHFTASEAAGHHVAFAAGSGITPVMSILRTVLEASNSNRFTLFYGNRTYEEIIFREEIERLMAQYGSRLTLVNVLSQEQRQGFAFGRMDTARLDSSIQQGVLAINDLAAVYLCGPSEMIFGLRDALQAKGLAEDALKYELFNTPVAEQGEGSSEQVSAAGEHTSGTSTTYILDGEKTIVAVSDPDATILDIGLAQGIDLPFACQGGVCCTCRAKVIKGKVDMRQNFSLGDSEVAEGYVLTCQSHPVGEDTIVDYDA